MALDNKKMIEILHNIAEQVEAEKAFLTELDTAIGDGDHGINLARGFQAVDKKLEQLGDTADIGSILKAAGMQLVATVGGASGPLYGTAFMKAGGACQGKTELDAAGFLTMMDAAIGGVKMRGKATTGEKTMLDALCPAYEALKEALESGDELKPAMDKAVIAAEKGVEYTKTIIATKGRASYLGERSLEHQDPGATSSLLMLRVIAENL